MAENAYRVSWELDEEEMVAVATVKEKDDNGDYQPIESEQFDLESVRGAGLTDKVALYGLSKVLQDRSSGVNTGPDKLEAMGEVFEDLKQGNWKKERAGAGGGSGISPVVEAIANIKGISFNEAARSWRETPKEQKDAIKANPTVADEVKRVKEARKEQGGADLSDLAS